MVTGHLGGRHSHQACYVYVLSIVYIIMLWISDGIHLFQGLSFTSSLAILMVAIRGSSRWTYALSLCLLGAGLLIREDTLAVVPGMLLLGYLYSLRIGAKQTYLYVYFG